MPEEILSLSTVVERTPISIDGKPYVLRNLADVGPYEYAAILQADSEVKALKAAKKHTPAQKRRAKQLLDETVKFILVKHAPDGTLTSAITAGVLGKLTTEQKEMIVFTWSEHIARQGAGAAEGNARPNRKARRTTGGSSPDSKRSTAATRKRGSTSRRGS